MQSTRSQIVVSQSDGELGIWRLDPAGGAPVEHTSPWPAHHLKGGIPTEAWISFFRRGAGDGGESFIVSGADDGLMKGWDLRAGGACGASPAFVCKEHDAGVTAGQWHPTREHIFVRWDHFDIAGLVVLLKLGRLYLPNFCPSRYRKYFGFCTMLRAVVGASCGTLQAAGNQVQYYYFQVAIGRCGDCLLVVSQLEPPPEEAPVLS